MQASTRLQARAGATARAGTRRPLSLLSASPAFHARASLPHPCAAAHASASSSMPAATTTTSTAPSIDRPRTTLTRRHRRPVAAARAANESGGGSGDDDSKTDASPPPPQGARDSWDEDDDAEEDAEAKAARQAEAAVDALLDPAWRSLRDAAVAEARASGASAEEASKIASMSLSEALDNDALLKGLAERELGPVLESLGLPRSQALPFLFDLVRLAAGAQLATAAAVFYGAEWFFALGPAEAWRCVFGLGFGYLARLAIPVEALAWPLYDGLVRAATGGQGYYEPGAGWGAAAAREEEEKEAEERRRRRRRRAALSGGGGGGGGGIEEGGTATKASAAAGGQAQDKEEEDDDASASVSTATARQRQQAFAAAWRLAALAAGCALVPPLVLGWSPEESAWQFAAPALAGAFCFDAAYLAALVLKLREVEGGGE